MKLEYQTVTDRCDIYIAFMERAIASLNLIGRFGVDRIKPIYEH